MQKQQRKRTRNYQSGEVKWMPEDGGWRLGVLGGIMEEW